MAGTDQSKERMSGGPVVVLVAPQLGENIGAAARAMLNFGLTELRLVSPRDGWPNEKAVASSSGAVAVIENAQIFATTEAAVADLEVVYATTARSRDMTKPVLTPERAAGRLRGFDGEGVKAGLLFGPERTGLTNDDVALADAIISVPVNPGFASINLAQAVLLLGYEWFRQGHEGPAEELPLGATRPASRGELVGFFDHLEGALEEAGFFHPPEKKPSMVRNLRNMFLRGALTQQEVNTLRGIITALTRFGVSHPKGRQGRQQMPGEEEDVS